MHVADLILEIYNIRLSVHLYYLMGRLLARTFSNEMCMIPLYASFNGISYNYGVYVYQRYISSVSKVDHMLIFYATLWLLAFDKLWD